MPRAWSERASTACSSTRWPPDAGCCSWCRELKAINPHVTIIAAGGVNLGNAAEYAATGVDGLATTCLHFAKPLDMSVRMSAL